MHVPQINEAEFPFFCLTSIGDGAWRVTDTRRHDHDGREIVGVIERVEGLYEVTSLRSPFRRTPAVSLEQALRQLVAVDPVEHPAGHLFQLR